MTLVSSGCLLSTGDLALRLFLTWYLFRTRIAQYFLNINMQSFTNPLSFSIPPTILVSKLVIVSYSPRMLNIDRIRYLVKQSLILNDVRVLPCYLTVSLYTIHSMKSPKVIHVVPFLVFSPPFVFPFAPSYLTFLFHHFHP